MIGPGSMWVPGPLGCPLPIVKGDYSGLGHSWKIRLEDRLSSTARIVSSSCAASIDSHCLSFYRAQRSSEDSRLRNVQQNSQGYERFPGQHRARSVQTFFMIA